MTEPYKKVLAAAGYHEIALGFRLGIWGEKDAEDLLLKDCSMEMLRERLKGFWECILRPQEEWGFLELAQRLELSEREIHIVLLAVLPWLNHEFIPVISGLGRGGCWSFEKAAALVEELLCIEELSYPECIMNKKGAQWEEVLSRLQNFFFPTLFEDWELKLDPVLIAHFTKEGRNPSWWTSSVEWHFPREMDQCREQLFEVNQEQFLSRMVRYLDHGKEVLHIFGPYGSGRRFFLKKAAERVGQALMLVSLKPELLEKEDAAVIVVREAILRESRLVLFCLSKDESGKEREHLFIEELQRRWGKKRPPMIIVEEEERGDCFSVPIPMADRKERLNLWKCMSKGICLSEDVSLEELADRYVLLPGQIKNIVRMAGRQAEFEGRGEINRELFFSCCHKQLKGNLEKRAEKVAVRFSWDDLLLEKKQKDKLLAAENQIRYHHQVFETWGLKEKQPYGQGISLVFSGPPGTGKTMAAQVLAGRMGLELYRVELASVVSKYIGETEKNLNEIFSEAQASQVVLFFDEADVLFGKRTEVRDSNDKYSNMEAAFLLQKMEGYSGVAILATNLLRNMDEAFKRRIRYLVEFPFPDRQWRLQIWERAFPDEMPVSGDLDLEFLASVFELSGAGIRNTVMQAAFLAASQGQVLGMESLLRAAKQEMEKNGKMIPEADLGPYGMILKG